MSIHDLQTELFSAPVESVLQPAPRKARPSMEHELRELMMEVFLDEEPVKRMLEVTALVPPPHRGAWHLVTHTLLARRLNVAAPTVAGRGSANAHTLAWTLSRQWQEPVLAQRWQRLISRMSDRQCRELLAQARRRPALH